MSLDEARKFCARRNSTLPIITDEYVDNVFQQFIVSDSYSLIQNRSVWIAAHARPVNNSVSWHWIDGRKSSDYSTSVKSNFPFTRWSWIEDSASSCKRCIIFVMSLTELILNLLITFLITVKLVEWTCCFAKFLVTSCKTYNVSNMRLYFRYSTIDLKCILHNNILCFVSKKSLSDNILSVSIVLCRRTVFLQQV